MIQIWFEMRTDSRKPRDSRGYADKRCMPAMDISTARHGREKGTFRHAVHGTGQDTAWQGAPAAKRKRCRPKLACIGRFHLSDGCKERYGASMVHHEDSAERRIRIFDVGRHDIVNVAQRDAMRRQFLDVDLSFGDEAEGEFHVGTRRPTDENIRIGCFADFPCGVMVARACTCTAAKVEIAKSCAPSACAYMNKVMLIGNVGQEPEIRYVDQGKAVARISLATTERGYTLQNGTQVPDHTDWHRVILWYKLAEIVEKYVHKGDKLYIEGRIRYSTYDDKQGQRRSMTEIWADNIELLSPRPATSLTEPGSTATE